MRLYSPDADALQALRGSDIQVILDVPNTDLQSVVSDPSSASSWVSANVKAYAPDVSFRYIAVGNEVIPGDAARYVGDEAQIHLDYALFTAPGTVVTDAPLLVNVYPYFSYVGDEAQIHLDYALFTAPGTVVTDGPYQYQNLFDAIMDSLYAALERVGGESVLIVVSESRWPSAGGYASTTVENARTYNQNLIGHVGKGTPKRPGGIEAYIFDMFDEDGKKGTPKRPGGIEAYIFDMFDEDGKGGVETEKHFGLFDPSTRQPKYPINFSG
ncbi:uncharacterized protein A4U43_C10F2800 [Asparagus officinalis]|uniref:Glucan endo-1,3-beta-D-glucosidase n=1 Tax=Asparagus officinalis TaxID=4686 RepID=A0A5P1E0N8_ASPOF|nr:uncharacterized protein A4U43_C10F2800 [Asparagus officinalis]